MTRRLTLLVVVGGTLALLLAGCSGGGGGGGGGPPTGSLTVMARVVTIIGTPIANATVWISGNGPFITNTNGEIVASGMPSPYDAVVVNGAHATGDVWLGLTRPDPVFAIITPLNTEFEADIDGTISGGVGWPVPITHETQVNTVFANALGGSSTNADATTGDYSFAGINWFGPLPSPVTMVASQFLADASGAPISFTGFGSLAIPGLVPNDVRTNVDIPLLPVPTTTITGTLTVPPGMAPFTKVLVLEPPAGGYIFYTVDADFSSAILVNAPVVAGFSRHLFGVAGDLTSGLSVLVLRRDLPAPAMNITIAAPEATGPVLPVDGATGIDEGSVFQVTPNMGDRVFAVRFSPAMGTGPTIRLHTRASSFTIPDLSAAGLSIPSGATYTWHVSAQGPLASVDEAAVLPDILLVAALVSNGSGDAFVSEGPSRNFTFAP